MAELSFAIEDGIGIITLDRPGTLNVFSSAMISGTTAPPYEPL